MYSRPPNDKQEPTPYLLSGSPRLIDTNNTKLMKTGTWSKQFVNANLQIHEWQNIYIQQFIQGLSLFRSSSNFIEKLNSEWDIDNIRAALFHTKLQRLPCILEALSTRHRYIFLSYFCSEGKQATSFITRIFHSDFLSLLDDITHKKTVMDKMAST